MARGSQILRRPIVVVERLFCRLLVVQQNHITPRCPLSISESTAERYTLADPDVRLMLQVRDDDGQAFEELMLRYQNRLVSLMTHLVGHRDLADDLTQEVFLRVYRARKGYVPGAKFSTWLFTIAGNVASNALRTLARRREVNLAPPRAGDTAGHSLEAAAVAASGQMPTRQLDTAERREAVQQAISGLNERQRMAILLAKFEDLSYAEIAEIMDMSPQAVKSLLSRARCNIRDALLPYWERGAKIDAASKDANIENNLPKSETKP